MAQSSSAADSAKTIITPKDARKSWIRPTDKAHVFQISRYIVHWLEIEDVLFHHDSAVMMPDRIAGAADQNRISGLAAIRAVYLHAKQYPKQKLLIAGHTDTSGPDAYNEKLSQLRASNVLHIVLGERDPWVGIALDKHKVEDYKQILTWIAAWMQWPCDPGGIDNKDDARTREAVRTFQQSYSDADFGEEIAIDGVVGSQTWGAFFEIYMKRLQELCYTDASGLAQRRTQVKWLYEDLKRIGCGEYHPIDEPFRENYRSQTNRRVELLFYEPGEEPSQKPGAVCHKGRKAAKDKCPIYNPKLYTYIYIVPRDLDLISVNDHFAPTHEPLDISYRIVGLDSSPVKLEITSPNYADNPIFTRELTADEKSDGIHAIQWDGKANCAAGTLKDRFINAACSPYSVRVTSDDGLSSEQPFKVLVHSLEFKLGKFDKGIFDHEDSTNQGQRERLKSLGYFHGAIADDANDAGFKKAVEWFQAEHDPGAAVRGVVGDSTKTKLKERLPYCIEGGELSSSVQKKIFVSGAFFFQASGDLSPGGHPRFTAEQNFWGDGLKIPVCAKIFLKAKNDAKADCPKAVGSLKVLFEWLDPADSAVLAGKQKDYVDKAIDYYKATTTPSGDNCHKDRGGKRGDDIARTFPENTDVAKFPFEVKKAAVRSGAVIATARTVEDDMEGLAGVIFRPSRMGGDNYRLRAYLHTSKDLDTDAEKDTAPECEQSTEQMTVWRRVRVNQYLHKPHAGINEINLATVNQEMAKACMEFVGSLAKSDIAQATWTATVNAALATDADFATIGAVNYASGNTMDFKTHAQYRAGGGALGAADYANLCRSKMDGWLSRIMTEFGKNQYHGLTLMRVANGHNAFFTNSGVAVEKTGCYVFWPKASYDGLGYVVEKYALHEMGHCLYLRHHYTSPAAGPEATWPASDNPDDHDADDAACAMSYYQTAWHLCGQCILKLRGWDEAQLSKTDDDNKKP